MRLPITPSPTKPSFAVETSRFTYTIQLAGPSFLDNSNLERGPRGMVEIAPLEVKRLDLFAAVKSFRLSRAVPWTIVRCCMYPKIVF
jgi:hypothetical protein